MNESVVNLVPDEIHHQDDRLNQYLHTIAHELRTPFVSIQGFASLLSEKYNDCLPNEARTYLNRIFTNLNRVDSLLTDITKLAKISIDENRFERVATQEIIDKALDSHVIELHHKKIEMRVQPHLPELYCDASAMVLVFSNLIGNAIKYSHEKRGGEIEIGYSDKEIFHKFFVWDNGVGFKAADRNKVFGLFNRLRNKRNVTGTGLGLSIVKQVVESHGGEVWVNSKKYKGAIFYFTLPK